MSETPSTQAATTNEAIILSEEKFNYDNLAMVVVKPATAELMEEVTDWVLEQTNEVGLEILHEDIIILDKDAVVTLYPSIFTDRADIPPDQAINYRNALLDYMTEAPCRVLILYGEKAPSVAEAIKYEIRKNLGSDFTTKYLKNFVHVPDNAEYSESLEAFYR